MAFDCLADGDKVLGGRRCPRRAALENCWRAGREPALLAVARDEDCVARSVARSQSGGALDGVIAKRLDQPYQPGERAMLKVKLRRTADCVVGGFRYDRQAAASARCCSGSMTMPASSTTSATPRRSPPKDRAAWTAELEAMKGGAGFTGKAPGGPSRWSTERSAEWQPLQPELVVEVLYDQVTGDRFRHGTKLLRRRRQGTEAMPDRAARPPADPAELEQLLGVKERTKRWRERTGARR